MRKNSHISDTTRCYFTSDMPLARGGGYVDLTACVDKVLAYVLLSVLIRVVSCTGGRIYIFGTYLIHVQITGIEILCGCETSKTCGSHYQERYLETSELIECN